MNIINHQIKYSYDKIDISADIDGFRLWYKIPPSYAVSSSGDPFLAASLLPAMIKGSDIRIEPNLKISPFLMRNINTIQEIHHTWNPKLKIISVNADIHPAKILNDGCGSFFSGGVDSTYTFLKNINEITHIINIHGFDFQLDKETRENLLFTTQDIKDLAQLAFKLVNRVDPVSKYLMDQFSEGTRKLLTAYVNSGFIIPERVDKNLSESFNNIITGDLIYDKNIFAGKKLRSQTKEMLMNNMAENRTLLNRLLIEDSYPKEILGKYSGEYDEVINRHKRFAEFFGKKLIAVETNFYSFGYRYNLSRNLTQGTALASIALLLGFRTVYIPASYSYSQLFPLGSHPLVDPLWSNEAVKIIHDGCESTRTQKIKKISENKYAVEHLQVCFDQALGNCGKCEKCIRTYVTLKLLNVPTIAFPISPSSREIRNAKISGDIEEAFFKENVDLALKNSNIKLRKELLSCLKRYERKKIYKDLDKILFRGIISKLYRNLKKEKPSIYRVDTKYP
ncbi:MAG: hypothetical protein QHH43_07720 [Candidatus Saccharicenans sp.]|jgi:hypothetical protein|nr:hypothetical protein [Candidatus Saccharicenans sp.]MDH7575625.1 hypothetical protein [Candidatus Saccharicenans sp.]